MNTNAHHTFVVPATRLRQGFAGVMTVGRRSFSEGAKQGAITTAFVAARKPSTRPPKP
jgi:hypothetical protein